MTTSPNSDRSILAIHLMPEENESNLLLGLIHSLADKYSGPIFSPHLTLCWGYPRDGVDASSLAQEIVQSFPKPQAQIIGIHVGSSFVRTLYLELEEDLLFSELHQRFRREFEIPPEFSFHPHLSLLYANLHPEEKELLKTKAHELAYPVIIPFQALHVIAARTSYTKPSDILEEKLLSRTLWPGK